MSTLVSVRENRHLIGGVEVSPDDRDWIERCDPATGELVSRVLAGRAEDTEAAIAAARRSFDAGEWRTLPAAERSRALLRLASLARERADELVRWEIAESGKPVRFARSDLDHSIDLIEHAAAAGRTLHGETYDTLGTGTFGMTLRQPIGVVGAIIAWNVPLILWASKVPFALAAGCSVVVKPSELTTTTAVELTKMAHEAGVPGDVLNLVCGRGPEVGQVLADSPDVDMVSLTGSARTAASLIASPTAHAKRLGFELGGKGATIVFGDAALEDALDGAMFGVYYNQGEACSAGTRLLVEQGVADEFMARLVERSRQLRVGNPREEGTDIGPMIHGDHARRVLDFLRTGKEQGADVLLGGDRADVGDDDAWFVPPTVLDRVPPESDVFRKEIFGPVLSCVRFDGVDEAIRIANDTSYGLANGVWTRDIDKAMKVARELRSGVAWVNTVFDGPATLPFGGVGASGNTREKGAAGVEEFTIDKTVVVGLGERPRHYS